MPSDREEYGQLVGELRRLLGDQFARAETVVRIAKESGLPPGRLREAAAYDMWATVISFAVRNDFLPQLVQNAADENGDRDFVSTLRKIEVRLQQLTSKNPRLLDDFAPAPEFNLRAELHPQIRVRNPKLSEYAKAVTDRRYSFFGSGAVLNIQNLLLNKYQAIFDRTQFCLSAYVQIIGDLPHRIELNKDLGTAVIESLAEQSSPYSLLIFVYRAIEHAKVRRAQDAAADLQSWLDATLKFCNCTVDELEGAAIDSKKEWPLESLNPPRPQLELAWRAEIGSRERVIREAYVRWGRVRYALSFEKWSSGKRETLVSEMLDVLDRDPRYRAVRFERIEVFVEPDALNHPWEYRHIEPGSALMHEWPVVLRLHRSGAERASLKVPPDPLCKSLLTAQLEQVSELGRAARQAGIFLAICPPEGGFESRLRQAVKSAGVGIWYRSSQPLQVVLALLDELDEKPLVELPKLLRHKKEQEYGPSTDLALLFDDPRLPPFYFSAAPFSAEHQAELNECIS